MSAARRTRFTRVIRRSRLAGRVAGFATLILALIPCLAFGGCVRRTITITSEPAGALCWLNGREVGRTPVTVDFLYYGVYDVQLTHEGNEPLLTSANAESPLWDTIPFDLASELWPKESHADIRWHFAMEPRRDDRAALLERAAELRQKLLTEAPIPPGTPNGQPHTQPQTQPGTQPVAPPADPFATTAPGSQPQPTPAAVPESPSVSMQPR